MLRRILLIVCACFVTAAAGLGPSKTVIDESQRMAVLEAVFPKAAISLAVGRSINDSWSVPEHSEQFSFPDALANEKVYRVIGPASDPIEKCAASDVLNEHAPSRTREVRLRVFPWPRADGSLLAVLQYAFIGANPPQSCYSMARVSGVTNVDGKWRESAGFDLDTTHHTSIQRIKLADLAGDHSQELSIESDWGLGGVTGASLSVFSLVHGRFDQWLNLPSRIYDRIGGDSFVQTLDVPRTAHEGAERFCFQKVTFAKSGRWLSKPITTHPCFQRFTGKSARAEMISAK